VFSEEPPQPHAAAESAGEPARGTGTAGEPDRAGM